MKSLERNIVKIVIPFIELTMAVFSIFYCVYRGFSSLQLTWLFNIAADLICLFISLFFIFGIVFGRETIGNKYSKFLIICHVNFLSLFLDFMSWMADGLVVYRSIIVLINTSLYISNLFLTASYSHFIVDMIVDNEKIRKITLRITDILLAATTITRLLNIKYGYFFTVSANGIYSRGPYQYLSYIYTILIEVVVIVLLIKSKADKEQKKAVMAFTILPFVASIVSIFIYGLSLMYACVLISIVMIYSAFFVELEEDRNKIIETFEKYISNEIVQKIVDNPSGKLIEGRRYTASVLVSDVRGFTALSESIDAESLVTILNHYFGVISEIVVNHGGIVTEFLGDGIMCVFGAPKANNTYAEDAIATALSIQAAMPEINAWNTENGYPEIKMGIGINTGTMVLGSLGNELHAKYSAVGQTIDRCFDIESCSIGGEVLISASTLRACKTSIDSEFITDYSPDPNEFAKIKIYKVNQIGEPYNIKYVNPIESPKKLSKKENGKLCIIAHKKTSIENYDCRVIGKSKDVLLIETKAALEILDDIKLTINKKTIFAKVRNIVNNNYEAIITTKLK